MELCKEISKHIIKYIKENFQIGNQSHLCKFWVVMLRRYWSQYCNMLVAGMQKHV